MDHRPEADLGPVPCENNGYMEPYEAQRVITGQWDWFWWPFLTDHYSAFADCFCISVFFFFVELINDSASNSRSFRINARFVRCQLYSRMWKLSSLLCCQYITVCSQPYKMPLRPCLFCISTPSLPHSLFPTSSSSHLSFSICLSSCNISVWPFHPLSLVCPSHLVWNPPPPFLHFSISLHLEGSLFPQGASFSLICPLEPFCVPLSFYFHSGCLLVANWYLCCGSNPSTAQPRDLKENLFSPQRDKSCWRDYIWFSAVITGSFGSAYSVALNSRFSASQLLSPLVSCPLKKISRVV